jgi:hypothetical protein
MPVTLFVAVKQQLDTLVTLTFFSEAVSRESLVQFCYSIFNSFIFWFFFRRVWFQTNHVILIVQAIQKFISNYVGSTQELFKSYALEVRYKTTKLTQTEIDGN